MTPRPEGMAPESTQDRIRDVYSEHIFTPNPTGAQPVQALACHGSRQPSTQLLDAVCTPWFVRLIGPLTRKLLGWGVPMGPDMLLTFRGRKTGEQRTVGVAVVEDRGRQWVIAANGNVNTPQGLPIVCRSPSSRSCSTDWPRRIAAR